LEVSPKTKVLLSLWQSLSTESDPLTFVDAHAGAGAYDLQQGAATFHRWGPNVEGWLPVDQKIDGRTSNQTRKFLII